MTERPMTVRPMTDRPMTGRPDPDRDWVKITLQLAKDSTDPSTQCASLLLLKDGCNTIGTNQCVMSHWEKYLGDRALKMQVTEHAERVAIYSAAFLGYSTFDATLFASWFACEDCARAIAFAGIKRVVGPIETQRMTPERWRPSINMGNQILDAHGVERVYLEGPWGVRLRFNGQEVEL